MGTYTGHIMTLANSIIGVSVLAMPFCFKQCGILLSVLMLIVSSVISRLACHFLMKSAILTKRRTFELLAFHLFGLNGKFMVELGIIGFLMGTCIAFFVVIGDLAPAIFVKLLGLTSSTATIRSTLLISIAIFCILPLGLLKNVDSLTNVCAATIGFYFCLVLKIITESLPHMLTGDWVNKVELWKPAGVLQCLPIFSMALCCQTQLFEMYDTLPNASLEKMNSVVRNAVNICTAVYIFIGFFGYVAFCSQQFTGNILMSFTPSVVTDVMKIGFVLSLACSFPLVIFPCRASLFSLLKRVQTLHDVSLYHIPENWFKWLTIIIVGISLIIGLLIPSIELVLGLVGSTIGVMICILFPTTCFIRVFTKNTNEKLLAQIMFVIGVAMMVLGTYTNLYAMEYSVSSPVVPELMEKNLQHKFEILLKSEEMRNDEIINKWESVINDRPIEIENKGKKSNENNLRIDHIKNADISSLNMFQKDALRSNEHVNPLENVIPATKNVLDNDIRQEPPQPVESEDVPKVVEEINGQPQLENAQVNNVPMTDSVVQHKLNDSLMALIKNFNDDNKKVHNSINDNNKKVNIAMSQLEENKNSGIKNTEDISLKPDTFETVKVKLGPVLETEKYQELLKLDNSSNVKKLQNTGVKEKTTESGRELLNEIKKQVDEAKQVLEEIKEQKKELDRKQEQNEIEKKKAVEQIKKIANIAISSLNTENDDKKTVKNHLKSGDDLILKLIPAQSINKLLQKPDAEKLNTALNMSEKIKSQKNNSSDSKKEQRSLEEKIDKKMPLVLSDVLSKGSSNFNLKNKQYTAPIPIVKANNIGKDFPDSSHKGQNVLLEDKNPVEVKINNNIVLKDKEVPNGEKPIKIKEEIRSKDFVDVPKTKSKDNKLTTEGDFKNDIKNMRRDILSNSIPTEHIEREKREIIKSPNIKEQQVNDDLNKNCEKRDYSIQDHKEVSSINTDNHNELNVRLNGIKLNKMSTKVLESNSGLDVDEKQLLSLDTGSLKQTLEHSVISRNLKTFSEYLKRVPQT